MRIFLLNALLFISLFLFGAGVSAQSLTKERVFLKNTKHKFLKATNARIAADITLSLPTFETKYFYDSETETWDVLGYVTNEYDKVGNLVVKAYFNEIDGDTIAKTIYQYNDKGREIGYIYYAVDYSTNSLIPNFGYKKEFTYDLDGRLASETIFEFDEDENDFYYSLKYTYEYTGNQQEPSSLTTFRWNESEWVELGVYKDLTWFDFSNFEVKSYTGENFIDEDGNTLRESFNSTSYRNGILLTEKLDGNEWMPFLRETSTIDENGNAISLTEEYVDNVWVNVSKFIDFVDEKGNDAGSESYHWMEDFWELEYSSRFENIYDINGILVEQIEAATYYDFTTFTKIVFSEFETFTITSSTNAIANFELNTFPNPVNDVLNITSPNMESAQIQLFTMQNVLVQTGYLESGNGTLNVSNLNAGVYMLKIQTASGLQKTERIVKR
jgi:hypothetical protein